MLIDNLKIGQKIAIPFDKNGNFLSSKGHKDFSHFVIGDLVWKSDSCGIIAFKEFPSDQKSSYIWSVGDYLRGAYNIPEDYQYAYTLLAHEQVELAKTHHLLSTAIVPLALSLISIKSKIANNITSSLE